MRVSLKKDIIVDATTKLFKNSEGTLIAVSWSDKDTDKYLVEIKGRRYLIDKKLADIYG